MTITLPCPSTAPHTHLQYAFGSVYGYHERFYIYDYTGGAYAAVHPNVSADGRTVTIVPNANLPGGHNMYLYSCYETDLDGNSASCISQYFTTSSTPETTPPTVINSNPVNNNTNAPTNAWIEVIFSKPVRSTSLGSMTFNSGGSVPFTAILNNNYYTDDTVVRLIPQQLLQPNTIYSVTVSGVQDVAGNTMSGTYTFQFTTGANFQTEGLQQPGDRNYRRRHRDLAYQRDPAECLG